jgi:hypothetical protein
MVVVFHDARGASICPFGPAAEGNTPYIYLGIVARPAGSYRPVHYVLGMDGADLMLLGTVLTLQITWTHSHYLCLQP